jgi:hypothetical protein
MDYLWIGFLRCSSSLGISAVAKELWIVTCKCCERLSGDMEVEEEKVSVHLLCNTLQAQLIQLMQLLVLRIIQEK